MNTRAQRATELSSVAADLAWLMGEASEMPASAMARGWQQDAPDGLRSLTWIEPGGQAVRVDLWAGGKKVLSTRLEAGGTAMEVITYKRGDWEQKLIGLVSFIDAGLREIMSPAAWGVTVH